MYKTMKTLIIYILMVLFSMPALAQDSNAFFEQLTNQYSDKDGFSASLITKDMFELYLKKKNVDDKSTVFDAIKNLEKIIIVSQNSFGGYTTGVVVSQNKDNQEEISSELYETILNHYKNGKYTLLKTEKRMGEEVKVYLKKNQDKVEALAVITNSSVKTNLIELQGDINLTAVADLNKTLNLRGLENLYKIDNSNMYSAGTAYGIYSQERIDEMVARQRELAERHREYFSEEQIKEFQQQAQLQAQKQMEQAEKFRQQMEETYGRQPIFLNYPGDTNTVYYLDGKKVKAREIKELNKNEIKSIEVNKADKDNEKTTIRIKTK